MKRNIIVAKNAFSADLCNKILKMSHIFQEGRIRDGAIDTRIRKSKTAWIDNNIDSCEIFHPIYKLTKEVNQKFFRFNITEAEVLQVTRYEEKDEGFYKPHIDGDYTNIDAQKVRKLSMSVQLTPPELYDGGTLYFPDDEEKFNAIDAMEQGTAVFFPSYMNHGVKPVTKGVRHSLVVWFLGEHFR